MTIKDNTNVVMQAVLL